MGLHFKKNIDGIMHFYDKVVFTDNIENKNALEQFIKNKYEKNDSFSYILWSVTQSASMAHSFISSNYTKAKLVAVIDKSKDGCFEGCNIARKEQILNYKEAIVLVCSDAAIEEASLFIEKNNIRDYFFVCQNGMNI